MRIGGILLEHGWVTSERLVQAVEEQPGTGLRLCSLLLARRCVAFDHASRALGEQHGVAAALRRHLAHRDPSLAGLLPPGLARTSVVLPIGRMRDGLLIVCARDPSPQLQEALEHTLGERIVLAVAPARHLEMLVAEAYPPPPEELAAAALAGADLVEADLEELEAELDASGELDVEALPEVDVELAAEADANAVEDSAALDFDIDADEDALATAEAANDFDIDVVPEPGQAGEDADTAVTEEAADAPPASRSLPVEIRPVAPAGAAADGRDALDALLASFADIDDVEWLLDVVMTYIAGRWAASILFEVRGASAIGLRGHGETMSNAAIRSTNISLAEPSIVQLARDERRMVEEAPEGAGPIQDRLAASLDGAGHPVAAPLTRGEEVAYLLVVGDPRDLDADDPEDAAMDVALLAEAMDEVLARLG